MSRRVQLGWLALIASYGANAQDFLFFAGFEADPVTVSLRVDPEAANPGGIVTAFWDVQGNFTSCETTERLLRTTTPPEFPPPIGWENESITPANAVGNQGYQVIESTTLELLCSGPGGIAIDTAFINTDCAPNAAPIPARCGVPANACPSYGAADDHRDPGQRWVEFSDAFALPWPGNSNVNRQLRVPTDQYIALRFDASNVLGQAGRINSDISVAGREKLASIAECPGEFDVAPECVRFDGFFNLFWANEDAAGDVPAGHCRLEPGKEYYLNAIFAAPDNLQETICPGGSFCIALLQQFVNQ